jgi:hypothetical protein
MALFMFEFYDPAGEMQRWTELVESSLSAVAAHMLIDPTDPFAPPAVAGATLPDEGDAWEAEVRLVSGVGGRLTRQTEFLGVYIFTNRGGTVVLTHRPPK